MGNTSKPLFIQLSADVYMANQPMWDELRAQGHRLQQLSYEDETPDMVLAPYAMRMTADMLVALPAALTLAIKGARALRYAPAGVTIGKGKGNVKAKKPRARKNSKVAATNDNTGVPQVSEGTPTTLRLYEGIGGEAGVEQASGGDPRPDSTGVSTTEL